MAVEKGLQKGKHIPEKLQLNWQRKCMTQYLVNSIHAYPNEPEYCFTFSCRVLFVFAFVLACQHVFNCGRWWNLVADRHLSLSHSAMLREREKQRETERKNRSHFYSNWSQVHIYNLLKPSAISAFCENSSFITTTVNRNTKDIAVSQKTMIVCKISTKTPCELYTLNGISLRWPCIPFNNFFIC